MSYQLKRINPFWHNHPMIPTAVIIGGICGLIGFQTSRPVIGGIGALVAAAGVLWGNLPLVSAVLGTMGVLGGILTFILVPNPNAVGMTLPMKLVSTGLFAIFYMILMGALLMIVTAIYNAYSNLVGLRSIRLELEASEEEETAA